MTSIRALLLDRSPEVHCTADPKAVATASEDRLADRVGVPIRLIRQGGGSVAGKGEGMGESDGDGGGSYAILGDAGASAGAGAGVSAGAGAKSGAGSLLAALQPKQSTESASANVRGASAGADDASQG